MVTRLWEQNKRFILITGAGLAVFLFFNWLIGKYHDSTRGLLSKATQLEKDCRGLVRELKGYWDEKNRLADYEKHEAALRADLELPPEKEIEKLDEAAPLVQFNQAIDRTWGQALDKANKASIAIPEKLGPQDFGVERGDTKRDYERHYSYLAVVRRGLHALIDAGMTEILRPELLPEEMVRVLPGDDSVQCLYRGVRFRVVGPYDGILKVLKSVQAPHEFLQANIANLQAKGGGDDRLVKADLELVAFRLVEGADAVQEKQEKQPVRKSTGRPRRTGR